MNKKLQRPDWKTQLVERFCSDRLLTPQEWDELQQMLTGWGWSYVAKKKKKGTRVQVRDSSGKEVVAFNL